ncbi:MAG TPA: cutinase family protein [Solirubrobacterales bacterium]|nr:cutinase family protein [Solirubrobacterales bacterium]
MKVGEHATLGVEPGAVIKAEKGVGVDAEGTVEARGTEAEPIVFTSFSDDSVGGDTNDDGSASEPKPGDWEGIVAGGGSTVELAHAAVDYARYGLEDSSRGVSVQTTSFAHNLDSAVRVDPAVGLDGVMGPGNSATANGLVDGVEVSCGELGVDSTITTSADWAFEDADRGCGNLRIPSGRTLTVSPGSVVKGDGGFIVVEGTLQAAGTAQAAVTFTSWGDGSAAGGVSGDVYGAAPDSPSAGDWEGIVAGGGSTVELEETDLLYASTALSVAEGAEATIHGSILQSTVGVSASDTFVDATDVDWGSPSGPSPIGSGTPYEGGGVLVTPWIGYTAPTIPTNTTPYVPPTDYHCTDVAFIGARGSGEAPQGDPPQYSGPDDGLGSRVGDAYDGFLSRLQQFGSSPNVKVLGVHYRALGTVFDPLKFGTDAYFESIYEGVEQLQEMIFDEESACPGEKLVLGGYSQGALVIHIALLDLARSAPSALSSSHLAAVLLIADPAKVGHGAEELWEGDLESAGGGVQNADGIWTKVPGLPDEDKGPIPSSVVGRTLAICHNHDIVCAPGSQSSVAHHTSYDSTETGDMGLWAADLYLGLPLPATI